jgi:hypothetical protein
MRPGVALRYKLEALGTEASERYLKGEGSLNDVVTKMASDNSLEPEEILRVAESANKATFINLFETQDDKYVEFPLANSQQILKDINKTAKEDYTMEELGAALEDAQKGTSLQELLPPQQLDKVASEGATIQKTPDDPRYETFPQMLREAAEKMPEVEKELRSDYIASKFAAEAQIKQFVGMVKAEVLQKDSPGHINKIACFLTEARPDLMPTINLLMQKAADDIQISHHWRGKEQLEKVAAAVPEDYFSQSLSIGTQPVEIINGDNPMVRQLDTTVEQIREVDRNGARYYEVRDQVKYLRGKVSEYIDREQKVGV